MRCLPTVAALALLLSACAGLEDAATPPPEPVAQDVGLPVADVIVIAEKVHTLDPELQHGTAVAVRGSRVLAVSTESGVLRYRGATTRMLHLRGAHVFPGLCDAHGHIAGYGSHLDEVDLGRAQSYDEVVALVAERAAGQPAGSWVSGRGWDQNRWSETAMPDHRELSQRVPEHPVLLTRVDGHAALVNERALALANVTAATKDPSGGRILRREDGTPSGVLVDRAMDLVRRLVPQADIATRRRRLLLAHDSLLRQGLTRVHDAGIDGQTRRLMRELESEGRWTLGVYGMLVAPQSAAALPPIEDPGPRALLRFRAVKLVADGALGSRGAALLAPYSDEPSHDGLLRTEEPLLRAQIGWCRDRGYQPCVHAIGDRANRVVLDAFASVLSAEDRERLRPRIEHAQVLAPTDLPRFAELGVIASMQPTHLTSDMPWAPQRLGPERVATAYAFRTLLERGTRLAFGSDFPVEPAPPFDGLFAATTTRPVRAPREEPLRPDQVLSRRQALDAFTNGAAYAAFEEEVRGQIRPGFEADLTIVDRDLLGEGALLGARVLATIVAGRIAFLPSTEERR